MKVEGNPLFP